MNIHFIPYQHIDKHKWDACITTAANGLVYAYSWYLDAMCNRWHALVLNDYEAVMPLTGRKKMGIHYLYQPYFCASLGVFAPIQPDEATVLTFLQNIPRKYQYWDICLNYGNDFRLQAYKPVRRRNFILSLEHNYDDLYATYRKNLKRNIQKAQQAGLFPTYEVDTAEVVSLAKPQLQRIAAIKDKYFQGFLRAAAEAKHRNMLKTIGIRDAHGNLLSSAVFLYSHRRWYYLLPGNHPNGKTLGASHYLLDRFIALHAGTPTLLDFEGSDVASLAFFYSSFGAREEYYPAIRLNKLPWWLRWLKRN